MVFCNVLYNALKFARGDTVHVDVREEISGMVRVSVRDTGIGISKENQKKLFQLFNNRNEESPTRSPMRSPNKSPLRPS